MDDNGGNKVTGIKQIVNLKRFLQKWQNVTLGPRQVHHGIPPAVTRRLRTPNVYAESDEDSCQSPDPPVDVPKGYLAVYVVPELRRFIIPTSYLSDPLFKVLLQKAEEEFGFDHSGGLTIPCEIETFKYLLQCMENKRKDQGDHH
ncbi:SAUR-like auxin-responsive protein family [Perilla frutescens var. hirtella]|uniref:SAUR-like auxin-responsive protein family n=1 Tax=Perilla frutescens var. hirtella TaxID=608512 RepID=A0AAD4JPB2_PERFH|nr:SAUR-like auxin-responsive protein family [Perilla frutescens var. hirtella]KAH6818397.1 SAUR-like auxin-responsive protein family [Perilla frutescens var. frutescens]KAH6837508.1 SAUR-like auxin-responsive protein family [Perilla frutescens var. hirtella]